MLIRTHTTNQQRHSSNQGVKYEYMQQTKHTLFWYWVPRERRRWSHSNFARSKLQIRFARENKYLLLSRLFDPMTSHECLNSYRALELKSSFIFDVKMANPKDIAKAFLDAYSGACASESNCVERTFACCANWYAYCCSLQADKTSADDCKVVVIV